jgi:hypothetical protein
MLCGMSDHHLAQVNIGRLRAPLDAPEIADFVAGLESINALADASPGFVWRLQDETGDATSIRPFGDDSILVNMSVWASFEALRAYVYDSEHVAYMRRRREWFTKLESALLALWWIPAGTLPTTMDARERLDHLDAHGPTPLAFTFRRAFTPAGPTHHAGTTSAPPRCPDKSTNGV